MPRQALGEHLVIGFGGSRRERIAERGEIVPRRIEIVTGEGDVLDTLAIIGAQIFLDLAAAARPPFVQRDTHLAVWRGHRLGRPAGLFSLYVQLDRKSAVLGKRVS